MATLISVLLCSASVSAQPAVPVLDARSKVATVIDGLHVKKDYWVVMPERNPDIYYVEIPLEPHTVTFTTDSGTVSFPVTYGSRHRFVVRLEDGTEAVTEIRSEFRSLLSPERLPGTGSDASAIPFTIGDNDKIYVKGRYNGGTPLDLQFDLGAGDSLIKKDSVDKVVMRFDATVTLHNSDGQHTVPSSSANTLAVGPFRWSGVSVAVADNMTYREDGIIGNSLFRDKVLEIDYDRQVLIVHDEPPAMSAGWTREDMVLDGGTMPFVRGALTIGGDEQRGWFLLDTGAYTSILHSSRLSAVTKFTGEFRRLLGPFGPRHAGPVMSVGGHAFADTNYSVRPYDNQDTEFGALGNDVLKRFNLVLDNRSGAVYFKPNGHVEDGFRNPERLVVRGALVAVGLVLVAFVIRRRPR